jgi:short-subunit dehydrogenase
MAAFRRGAVLLAAGAVGAGLVLRQRDRHRRALDFRDSVVLVTGGSRGLGLLLAREFGREGATVAICARDAAELERARAWLAEHGVTATTSVCDVADRGAVERMIDEVRQRHGVPDVLVNNAGIIQVGPIDTMTHEDFRRSMDINFWGTVNTTLTVLPEMRRRGRGRIVNITSIGGKVSVPHLLPYGAAKFAAVGFSEGLRAELEGEGVDVVTIVPGLMRTGSHVNAEFKGNAEAESRWFSLGATLPLVSMDAERAARQIVRAARHGSTVRVLSLPAIALATAHGVAPGVVTRGLGAVQQLILPEGETGPAVRGMELEQPGWLRTLTRLGRVAARRFRQYPGPVGASRAAGGQ